MEQQDLLQPYEGYRETQLEILAQQRKNLRNNIITIGILFFIIDMFSMLITDNFSLYVFSVSLVFPALYTGLAFLSLKQPLLAVIICAVLLLLLLVAQVFTAGAAALVSGWLFKAFIVYLHISIYRKAVEIKETEKEIQVMS